MTYASATLITSFTNCLPEVIQQSPTHLQFHPLAVDAIFDLSQFPYALNITVYGNVTGSSSANPEGDGETSKRWIPRLVMRGTSPQEREIIGNEHAGPESRSLISTELEGVDSTPHSHQDMVGSMQRDVERRIFKRDDIVYKTGGNIVDIDETWSNKATTLQSIVNVLTFQLYNGFSRFCSNANVCPMESVDNIRFVVNLVVFFFLMALIYHFQSIVDPRVLPSFMVSTVLRDSYALTSVINTFIIISGDPAATQIGCIRVEVTPILSSAVSDTFRWTPVAILVFVGLATISAATLNPWNGTKDVFRWSSNYGMDDDMLRLVTPGFGDTLQYLQFAVLTGSLTLAYPGFFQPVLSKAAWSILLFNTNLSSQGSIPAVDNLYMVDSKFGLQRMAEYVGIGLAKDIWPITMLYLAGILIVVVFIIQVGFVIRWGFMKVKAIAEEDLRAKNRPFTFGESTSASWIFQFSHC